MSESFWKGFFDWIGRPAFPRYDEEVVPFDTGDPVVDSFFAAMLKPGRSLRQELQNKRVKRLKQMIDDEDKYPIVIDVEPMKIEKK